MAVFIIPANRKQFAPKGRQSQPPRAQYLKEIPCSWHWPASLFRRMKSKDSGVAIAFVFLGGLNGLVAILGLGLLVLGGDGVAANAAITLIAGLSGMLGCFAIAAVVQHLCNIDHRLNSNNKLLSQLLRAYGHEPEE